MKTPQEQAEEMVHKTVQPVMFFTETQQRLERHLLETIPLSELIAVAQAAIKYAGPASECCMTGERTGEVCDLHCAIEALRTTGKVEL